MRVWVWSISSPLSRLRAATATLSSGRKWTATSTRETADINRLLSKKPGKAIFQHMGRAEKLQRGRGLAAFLSRSERATLKSILPAKPATRRCHFCELCQQFVKSPGNDVMILAYQ